MTRIVNQPFGELIHQEGEGDLEWQLRFFNGHVYGFQKELNSPDDPTEKKTPTGNWSVSDFGFPNQAKRAYPGHVKRIDEVCS